jgi:mono/diheme cytochrome c family protein
MSGVRPVLVLLALTALPTALPAQQAGPAVTPRTAYLLSCGGCHGESGVSNPVLVPDLKDQVGFYLKIPQGRRYLVQLPNVAFSMNSDEQLAALLNYVVFTLGGDSAPRDARPYTAREVATLRRTPLTEVSLLQVRKQLVDTLIEKYNITSALRRYGEDAYGEPGSP